MLAYLVIGFGSALGGMARYFMQTIFATITGGAFPYGTLFVNVTGSLVIGFFATFTGPDSRFIVGVPTRQFVMVGICGGYTTFSSFSLETLNLIRGGEFIPAVLNAVGSVALCLIFVWVGHVVAANLSQ